MWDDQAWWSVCTYASKPPSGDFMTTQFVLLIAKMRTHIYEPVGRRPTYPSMWRGQDSSEPRTPQPAISVRSLSIAQTFGVDSCLSYVDNKYSEPCLLRAFPWISGNFLFSLLFPFGLSAYFVSWFILDLAVRQCSFCFLKSLTKHGRRCRSPYDHPRFMYSIFDKSPCVFVLDTIYYVDTYSNDSGPGQRV